ncbi:glycolate oxidase subunit GlcF [Sulfuriferula sp. GW1]|uniref:glycolate oxidase subunit GlcF n=1 Tax=Sulfuriferula sp. GW1 TaxID=3345111 RepID=UPI0039B05045
MQTQLADFIRDTPEGVEAERILRSCVHCGFCLATCPTYQILGDELDSPRGRIYLMKQYLESGEVSEKTQLHLDRCLTCRNCETTCPSGVEYSKLLDIGRGLIEKQVPRSPLAAMQRYALRQVLPRPTLFSSLLALGHAARPFLPASLKSKLPAKQNSSSRPKGRHARHMLVLEGCVQPALAPNINAAAARLLDKIGISLVAADKAGCCGAVSYHLNAQDEGLDYMRRNIDAWWPLLEAGAEAIVMTASGCGVTVKEYGHYLQHDPAYAAKAARVSALTRDLSEVVLAEAEVLKSQFEPLPKPRARVAFHAPCTLQHGQKITGVVEALLTVAGFEVISVSESNLCCGSAGTYSILQPEISTQLRERKLGHLQARQPEVIATANIGCLTHLQSGTATPVRHWIELLDEV